MGDIADDLTEQGVYALALHHSGACSELLGSCPYCETESETQAMAAQTGKAQLFNRLGSQFNEAWNKLKGQEINYGEHRLPAGINNGTAHLKTAEWGEFKGGANKGQPFVLLRGVAVLPEEHAGIKVKNQGVMVTIPMCNTEGPVYQTFGQVPGLFENWVMYLRDHLGRLGIEPDDLNSMQDVDSALTVLQRRQPFYHYSTRGFTPKPTKDRPNPTEFVEVIFHSACEPPEGFNEANPASGVNDNTKPSANGSVSAPTREIKSQVPEPTSPTGPQYSDETDLDSLARRADTKDKKGNPVDQEAIDQLTEFATKAGLTDKQIDDAASWAQVVEMMKTPAKEEASKGKGKGGAKMHTVKEEPSGVEWKVGEVCMYKSVNPTTKKRNPKPTEHEIISVNGEEGTCELKPLDEPRRRIKGVSLEELEAT